MISRSFKAYDYFLKHLGPLIVDLFHVIATQSALQTFSYVNSHDQ